MLVVKTGQFFIFVGLTTIAPALCPIVVVVG